MMLLRDELDSLGVKDSIALSGVVQPLDFHELVAIAREAGIWGDPPIP
ncbi:hypothetical protein [Nocardia sp. NPDC051570]